MLSTDLVLLLNWIISGFIGLLFGILGGYATYRFEKKRDDLRWERKKLQMEMMWQQKLKELEIVFLKDERDRLRDELTRGVDNPIATITQLQKWDLYMNRKESEVAFYQAMQKIIMTCSDIHSKGISMEEIGDALTQWADKKILELKESRSDDISEDNIKVQSIDDK